MMKKQKHMIIGTAGHIDHGKTWLVKALTGTDTDRLEEEKRRGITIENGFAALALPGGELAGIIDVPGHEKFIKNMLAGAGGIDIALLVIAADEGVMPQTVEHLEILSLLGIRKGVIVITKSDLTPVSDLRKGIEILVRGTFLENAPVMVTSARDGTGIEELKELLYLLCQEQQEESEPPGKNSFKMQKKKESYQSDFRLCIDRVFSMQGFGTVVTGTLLDGTLDRQMEVLLYPSERYVKIRQIQVYGEKVERAYPGQRVAVNLSGISKEEISRGEVLARAGSIKSIMTAEVQLQMLDSGKRSLKNGSRVHLYCGAAQVVCRVCFSDRKFLKPGNTAVVQLRMEQPVVMKAGDHFVIRFYSPLETIGGGVVQNPYAVRTGKTKTQKSMVQSGQVCMQLENSSRKPAAQKQMELQIQKTYLEAGFVPPFTSEVKEKFGKKAEFSAAFFSMVRNQILIKYDENHYIHKNFRQKALNMAVTLYREDGQIRTGVFRDRLEISRKCAITLLEGLDREHITYLKDGTRTLTRSYLSGGNIWESNPSGTK